MTRMGIAKVLDDTFAKAKKYMEDKEQNKEVEYDPDMEALCLALKEKFHVRSTVHSMICSQQLR